MFDDIFDDGQIVVPYILIPRCNKQTTKKEEKCVTKYWRTSLTKFILEAYFPALKR